MKKIEFIWRHLLTETLAKRQNSFQQQDLAKLFGLSSSTVNLALKPLRELGAVRVFKRGFEVVDGEKILYHWANHRRLAADIRFQIRVNLPVLEIEGRLPDGAVPTVYTAVRERFGEPPAEYDKVYCYHNDPSVVTARFAGETTAGPANLVVLQSDPFLADPVSLAQLFVDLWSLPDWFARDSVNFLKAKIDELLP